MNHLNLNPIFVFQIAADVKEEWIRKERGSWEDHGEPTSGHIYPLLESMPKTRIKCFTKEEIDMVLESAYNQESWCGESRLIERLIKTARGIISAIKKLNN